MTWIGTVPPRAAKGELRDVYRELYGRFPAEYRTEVQALRNPDGSSDSIVESHSLLPDAMRHMFGGLAALLRPDTPLDRRRQEMIATAVSVANGCRY